jgi:hypothetical protein
MISFYKYRKRIMKQVDSYIMFLQQKDLQRSINNYLNEIEKSRISPRHFYTMLLTEIFQNMKQQSLSDEEIDIILTQSLFPSKEFIYAINNN